VAKTIFVDVRRNVLSRQKIIALLSSLVATAALLLVPAQAGYAQTIIIGSPIILRNPASGQMGCIQPPGFEKDIQLTTAPCDGSNIQHWTIELAGTVGQTPVFHIVNFATGYCMRATSNRDFAPVTQIDCTGISDEKWDFHGDGTFRSEISTGGAPCLDLQQGPSTTIPKPIDVFHCTSNNAAQIFTD
jgi:hypothetical protein